MTSWLIRIWLLLIVFMECFENIQRLKFINKNSDYIIGCYIKNVLSHDFENL